MTSLLGALSLLPGRARLQTCAGVWLQGETDGADRGAGGAAPAGPPQAPEGDLVAVVVLTDTPSVSSACSSDGDGSDSDWGTILQTPPRLVPLQNPDPETPATQPLELTPAERFRLAKKQNSAHAAVAAARKSKANTSAQHRNEALALARKRDAQLGNSAVAVRPRNTGTELVPLFDDLPQVRAAVIVRL